MSDQATQSICIAATPEQCFSAVANVEQYPSWAHDIKEANVRSSGNDGRPHHVEFRAAAMGRSTRYILNYDFSGAPNTVSWSLESGDIMRTLDGTYTFASSTTVPGATDVAYHLEVDLVVPLPGFVKRRAEARIVHTALQELKALLEQ